MRTNVKRKTGISLIVLVITIIVMIILATAIILSLSNSSIIGRANEAKSKYNRKADNEAIMMIANKYKLNDVDKVNDEQFKNELIKEIGNNTKIVEKNGGVEVTTKNGIFFVDNDWTVTDVTENKWGNITVTGDLEKYATLSDEELEEKMLDGRIYPEREQALRININQEEGIKWQYHTRGSSYFNLNVDDITEPYFDLPIMCKGDNYGETDTIVERELHAKIHEMQYTLESTGETYTKLYSVYDFYGRGYVNMSSETNVVEYERKVNSTRSFPDIMIPKVNYKIEYNWQDGEYDSNKYELMFYTIVKADDDKGTTIARKKDYTSNFRGTKVVEYTYVFNTTVKVYTLAVLCDKSTHSGIQILGQLQTYNSVKWDSLYQSLEIGKWEEFLY